MTTHPQPQREENEVPVQGPATGPQDNQEEIPVVSGEEVVPVITGEDLQRLTGRPATNPTDNDEEAPQGSARLRKRRRWYAHLWDSILRFLNLR